MSKRGDGVASNSFRFEKNALGIAAHCTTVTTPSKGMEADFALSYNDAITTCCMLYRRDDFGVLGADIF
jgi:hypothetical protein